MMGLLTTTMPRQLGKAQGCLLIYGGRTMNMLISIVVEADSPSLAAVAAIVIGCGVSYEEDLLVDAFRRVPWPPVWMHRLQRD